MDTLTPEQRKKTMSRVCSQDTKPELLVRRLVFGMGYRYRLNKSNLPGKPDLTFPKQEKVIFVHGCFWHGHDCRAGLNTPRSNQSYWSLKLTRNKERDMANQTKLQEIGWESLVLWECQLKDKPSLENQIKNFLETVR